MAGNKGKAFEQKFLQDWKKSFPGTFIYRLHDQVSGYKVVSQNPCDFIGFNNKQLWLIEAKSHEGSSIPFSAIPQYERLVEYINYPDINSVLIIWFIDKDIVIAVPIEEAKKMVDDGEKSIGLRMLDKKQYNIIVLPSVKRRVFLDVDYTVLVKALNKEE